MERTTFGGLLTGFQKEVKLVLEQTRRALKKKHPRVGDHEFRESKIVTANGETVYTVELWKKVDEEHIKINTRVETQMLEKVDLEKLKTPPKPPEPTQPPDPEPEKADALKELMD